MALIDRHSRHYRDPTRRVSAASIRRMVAGLRPCWDRAVVEEIIPANPWDAVDLGLRAFGGGKRSTDTTLGADVDVVLDPSQVWALAEACVEHGTWGATVRGFVLAMGFCGLRPNEAAGLLVGDLETGPGPFVTAAMVVAETAYLLERQLGAEAEVAPYDLILDGTLRVESLTKFDWVRVRVLVWWIATGIFRSAEPTPVSLRSPNAYGCRVSPRLTERTSPWFAPTTSKPPNSSHLLAGGQGGGGVLTATGGRLAWSGAATGRRRAAVRAVGGGKIMPALLLDVVRGFSTVPSLPSAPAILNVALRIPSEPSRTKGTV